jgi:pyruvate,water dikinase
MSFILFFEQIENHHHALVGGKGYSLADMVRTGLRVPRGFCVTTDGYRHFLAANRLERHIEERLAGLDYKNTPLLRNIAADIQNRMLAAVIPENIGKDIVNAWSKLVQGNTTRLAVRSSAVAEDTPDASFAGQHDTFLGIEGETNLLEAVRKCWASLWTARVIQYRTRAGYSHKEAALAVVVQELIPAETAGVTFTVNPVNGSREEMVINATWGLGESLVGGLVDADQVIFSRKDGKVKEYRLGQKQKTSKLSPEQNGTTTLDTKAETAAKRSLTEAQITALADMAKAVEAKKGVPQDIEWCIWQNTIYLLQARPITTLASAPVTSAGEEEHWTADNAQEAFPNVVSPFTMGFIEGLLESQFRLICRSLGVDVSALKFVAFFDGYVYLSATSLKKMLREILPVADEDALLKQILGCGEEGSFKIKIKPSLKIFRLIRFVFITSRDTLMLPRQSRRFLQNLFTALEKISHQDMGTMSAGEVDAIYHTMLDIAYEGFLVHALGTGAYATFYGALTELVRALPASLGITASIFLSNTGTLEDAKLQQKLRALAESARQTPAVASLIVREDVSQITVKLQNLPEAQVFCTHWQKFMAQFGHMGDNLQDVIAPRWAEDPSSLWKLLKTELSCPRRDFQAQESALVSARDEAIAKVERYLSRGLRRFFPIGRWRFTFLRKCAIHFAPYRENNKFHLLKGIAVLRRIVWRWGQLLQEKGIARMPDDAFFLNATEIFEALQGKSDVARLQAEIAARRAQRAVWEKMVPPHNVYTAGGKVVRKVYEKNVPSGRELKGVAASAGLVQGKARIIFDLGQAEKLKPGEILVTRFTDPAWTPLFSLAAGVVMDIGSMLSHGAVVARELGLPAVVGVRCATDVIADGQEIIIDGNRGVVVLLGDRDGK